MEINNKINITNQKILWVRQKKKKEFLNSFKSRHKEYKKKKETHTYTQKHN